MASDGENEKESRSEVAIHPTNIAKLKSGLLTLFRTLELDAAE